MSTTPEPVDTSAAEVIAGFDYQFYYFLYLILGLQCGEQIGFEVKEDIHVDTTGGKTILIQTKHSTSTRSDGQIINLTERSGDLWKTLYNWAQLTSVQTNAAAFLSQTTFQLVTNKSNARNPFIQNVRSVRDKSMTFSDFKKYLTDLIKTTTDSDIVLYMKGVKKLNTLLPSFLSAIEFDVNEDNLIERIKERIFGKILSRDKVDDVYHVLHSALTDKKYLTIKEGEKIIVTFDDFVLHFRNCFKNGFSTKLLIRDIPFTLPEKTTDQLFVKQLQDIGEIVGDDRDKIILLTTHMLKYFNNLQYWISNDGLLPSQVETFNRNSKLIWKNSFDKCYRSISKKLAEGASVDALEDDIQASALNCLDEMRKEILKIDETELDTELSNGHFYYLNEHRSIGWHFNWKTKY